MGDIKMVVRMCEVEHVPVENSHFHRLVIEDFGQEAANGFTYEIEVPDDELNFSFDQIMQSGSNELKEMAFLITGGEAPGGRKERDAS
ncbi:hypothetical protein [Paenibacillus spongiae]|uniref:Uncharacterized protein n=1 Tax=Paenibacillus spongiae TaxID=2909671 RepID=A0ABY5SBA9_9BACL|nr:hypothetical protein [Paenibacillus spongiae]UVI31224.1 hypothetical protein L1F29_05105 [Paenibacillus spongiae]